MSSNRLRLNPDKTEFIWFGTRHQLSNLNSRSISVIPSSTSVRDLGVLLDSELTMEGHISKLCQSCFFQLRRLRSIRHSLSRHALLTLVHAFISSRLDFCNSVLYGVSAYLLDRLQSILNAAARLILKVSKYDHISDAMRNELHLAPYCATYQLQDLPSRAQLSGGYWSNVPIRILQPGELRGRKTSSSFCCPIRSGGASIPP